MVFLLQEPKQTETGNIRIKLDTAEKRSVNSNIQLWKLHKIMCRHKKMKKMNRASGTYGIISDSLIYMHLWSQKDKRERR